MMRPDVLLSLPVLVPLAGIALSLMMWRWPRAQRAVSLVASFGLLGSAVALIMAVHDGTVLATQFGSWPAPFGITFVGDMLSAVMVLITGVMAVVIGIYGLADDAKAREHAFFHPLYQGLLLGVSGAFLTGDIFNLYVWFEVLLISSFGLLVLGGTKAQLDAGVKYVALNLVVTTLFLVTVGFLYGATGTLNMADLARVLPTIENQGLVATLAILFLLAFGAKAAVFPLFYWLPAAYHTASVPVVAIFVALLTKVGVYAIIRTFTLMFDGTASVTAPVVGVIAALTMITGVLGAIAHSDIRRILSFQHISQIGYMLLGIAVATPLAVGGAILYMMHHVVVKANLFLVAGVINRAGGSYHLKEVGGLYRGLPFVAVMFAIPALSLAGIPPLSGFWAKFGVIKASLDAGHIALGATGLAVGLLTLYSMGTVWNEAFWKAAPSRSEAAERAWKAEPGTRFLMLLPIAMLGAVTLTIGLWAEPFFEYALRAGEQLLDKTAYIDAVFPPDAAQPGVVEEVQP